MSTAEIVGMFGAALSALLTIVIALIGIVYRNDQKQAERNVSSAETRIVALEKQNTEQETRIATLVANLSHAAGQDNRLYTSLDKLDGRIDELSHEIGALRGELTTLSRRMTGGGGTGSPGTMPAVRPGR